MVPIVYILLKDTITAKAGEVYEKNEVTGLYGRQTNIDDFKYFPEQVENNPEWFKAGVKESDLGKKRLGDLKKVEFHSASDMVVFYFSQHMIPVEVSKIRIIINALDGKRSVPDAVADAYIFEWREKANQANEVVRTLQMAKDSILELSKKASGKWSDEDMKKLISFVKEAMTFNRDVVIKDSPEYILEQFTKKKEGRYSVSSH
jgi:hypothetical protein